MSLRDKRMPSLADKHDNEAATKKVVKKTEKTKKKTKKK